MPPRSILLLALASFAIGTLAGYFVWSPEREVKSQAPALGTADASNAGTATSGGKQARISAIRTPKPVIGKDEAGNFLLPAALASRFQYIGLHDDKVNRKDLRVLGLSEAEMDDMDELIRDAMKRAGERGRPLMEEFTRNADEIVWKVRGDATATEEKERVAGELRRILGGDSRSEMEERLLEEIGRLTTPCGTNDYFIYVARSETTPGYLSFNRVQLTVRPGGAPLPSPGDSFKGIRDRYFYQSISPNGGITPPVEYKALLEGRNWESLLPKK